MISVTEIFEHSDWAGYEYHSGLQVREEGNFAISR